MQQKVTESASKYNHLEKMSIKKILASINNEDKTVPYAIEKAIPQIEKMVYVIVEKMKSGGRLFYIGAGTSGRLGILDASECPPTYGVEQGLVVGLIAGGDKAIRKAVEFAEDDTKGAWNDLKKHKINNKDVVIGIAASGSTPYVLGGIELCNKNNIVTGGITCNPNSALAKVAQYPIEVVVGPEFVTGSTRMKAGSAQKMVLNMISTSVMVKLGKVKGNVMVDMQLSNLKLIDRGTKILVRSLNLPYEKAKKMLLKHGSVRRVMDEF